MAITTSTRDDRQAAPTTRHTSADLKIGLILLGSVIGGRLLWAATDGGFLAAVGLR